MLQDMAILTGGEVISEETGMSLEKAGLEELGTQNALSSRKKTAPLSTALAPPMTSLLALSKSALKSKRLLPITTVKSCKNV